MARLGLPSCPRYLRYDTYVVSVLSPRIFQIVVVILNRTCSFS
jgi:hypothetical protein